MGHWNVGRFDGGPWAVGNGWVIDFNVYPTSANEVFAEADVKRDLARVMMHVKALVAAFLRVRDHKRMVMIQAVREQLDG